MAVSVRRNPLPIMHNCDSNYIELQTDLVQTNQAPQGLSYVDICIEDTLGPQVGEQITLTINGVAFTFTFVATPAGAFDLPAWDGVMSLQDYANAVEAAFAANIDIACNFQMRQFPNGPEICIRLRANDTSITTITNTSNATGILIDDRSNADNYLEDNISIKLKIQMSLSFEGVIKNILLEAPIDEEGRVCFDLKKLLPISCYLPEVNTIQAFNNSFFFTENNDGLLSLSAAECYGNPSVNSKLFDIGDIVVFPGANPAGTQLGQSFFPASQFLHSYINCYTKEPLCKPVTKEQPDWLYIYALVFQQYDVEVELEYITGIKETFALPFQGLTFFETVLYLPTGYNQLDIDSFKTDEVCKYKVTIMTDDGEWSVCYELQDCCHPWNCYLLYCNGLGGMETALMKGKKTEGIEVEKEVYKKSNFKIPLENKARIGSYSSTKAKARYRYQINTGWQSKAYIRHLSQMIMDDVYMIDLDGIEYRKMIIENTSIQVSETDQDLHSLEIIFKSAYEDQTLICLP